jgi:hypothetical protein
VTSDTSNLRQAFVKEALTELATQPTLLLPLGPLEAWIVLTQLQLALRHPRNTGPVALVAEGIALRLQEYVAPPGTFRAEMAARGWERAHDLSSEPPDAPTDALAALLDHARTAEGVLSTLGQQDETRGAYYEAVARKLASAIAAVEPASCPDRPTAEPTP